MNCSRSRFLLLIAPIFFLTFATTHATPSQNQLESVIKKYYKGFRIPKRSEIVMFNPKDSPLIEGNFDFDNEIDFATLIISGKLMTPDYRPKGSPPLYKGKIVVCFNRTKGNYECKTVFDVFTSIPSSHGNISTIKSRKQECFLDIPIKASKVYKADGIGTGYGESEGGYGIYFWNGKSFDHCGTAD
jgi:hypothetical protein